MAAVYLAEDVTLGQRVALKLLKREHAERSRRCWRASTARPRR